MHNAQHTPAPWKLHRHPSGSESIVTDNEEMMHIMHIQEARGLGAAAEANARLIVAAPRLLAALERVVGMTDRQPGNYQPQWLIEAIAAISAAKGSV